MQELFLAKLENLGVDASKFGLHIGVRVGHLLQLMQVWLIAYSSCIYSRMAIRIS